MSDLAIQFTDGLADLVVLNGDLQLDDSLLPSVLVSLGTDRRAAASDFIPDGTDDRRGWWADFLTTDPLGSRLWLLARSRHTPETLTSAQDYAAEALQWLVDDGIWSAMDILASVPDRKTLLISIRPTYPNGQTGDVITLTVPRISL
ncbi:MAG TPA: phage GP46 family protein [Fluviicoccus sp.]|nr:phage GP46 family protein [Fluviicoccus sp.]